MYQLQMYYELLHATYKLHSSHSWITKHDTCNICLWYVSVENENEWMHAATDRIVNTDKSESEKNKTTEEEKKYENNIRF